MQIAPLPATEVERLKALTQCRILDTPPEPAYDALTQMAAMVCGAPVSLISLVDRDRQWFKSTCGLDARQTSRNVAFCAHAILDTDLFEVSDAQLDPRFCDNPLVTDSPYIRYYAGMPLIGTTGYALGTLCVIDYKPRRLDKNQRAALQHFAKIVVTLLESRTLQTDAARFGAMLDQSQTELYAFETTTLQLVRMSEAARQNNRYPAEAMLTLHDLQPAYSQTMLDQLLTPLRAGKQWECRYQTYHRRQNGSTYPVDVRLQLAEKENPPVFIAQVVNLEQPNMSHAALRAENVWLQTIIDSFPALVAFVGLNRRYQFVNDYYCQQTERSYDDLVGQLFGTGFDYTAQTEMETQGNAALNGHIVDYELTVDTGDRRIIYQVTHWPRYTSKNGPVDGFYFIALDHTARRMVEMERDQLQQELLVASRAVGRAEIASGILHNIGNILNSLNTTITVAMDLLENSRLPGLRKAFDLLNSNTDGMTHLLQHHPKGQQLHAYLQLLAPCLESEQNKIRAKLNIINEHTEHIKRVVEQQQRFAHSVSQAELIEPTKLMDDVLDLCINQQQLIMVERHYQPQMSIWVDRHSLQQILLNLVNNAKDAIAGLNTSGHLKVMIGEAESDNIQFVVQDNGTGVDPTHLKQLFDYGFTTKLSGHGFGLHTCANLAKAMGGELQVASNGLNQGATFTLRLPQGSQA